MFRVPSLAPVSGSLTSKGLGVASRKPPRPSRAPRGMKPTVRVVRGGPTSVGSLSKVTGTVTFTNPVPTDPARFYRAKLLP